MTNNMDEFEHEDLGPIEPAGGENGGGFKKNITEAWRTQPLFKLMVIMIIVGVAIAGALGVFSGPSSSDASKMVHPPEINEPPGSKASPYFIEQNKQANAERANQAIQEGSSAMPTPVGQNIDIGDLTNKKKEDPLAEFRAETERLKQEMTQQQQQNVQQIQALQQQTQQRPQPQSQEDNSLAQAMQRQMQQLMESWTPHNMKVVEGTGAKEKEKNQETQAAESASAQMASASAAAAQMSAGRTIVQAGTVNYAQLLTEANSDVPGPILAQVLSGPLAGGRAIGHFKTENDFLVIEFNLVNLKGKDYPVTVLALDPNTTLGGMATEVDHRYFDRILLPAAAEFAQQFGSTLGQGSSQVAVTNGAVVVDQAKRSTREALFAGMGQAGQSVGQFLQQEASQIRPLVRVAAGTPMGLFFLSSVKENPEQNLTPAGMYPTQPGMGNYTGAGNMGGFSGVPGYANPNMGYPTQTGYSQTGYPQTGNPYNPYSTNAYSSTGYNPAAGGGYAPGYNNTQGYAPGNQQMPGSGVTIITPGQTGLGTGYYGR